LSAYPQVGVLVMLGSVPLGAVFGLSLIAIAEAINPIIDIERNMRQAAKRRM
jgi:hypothetical protein